MGKMFPMPWSEAVGIAVAAIAVGLLVLFFVWLFVQAARAGFYESRGYKVTHPSWFEGLFGDGLVRVEVPEHFVATHKWLDCGLKFEVRADVEEK